MQRSIKFHLKITQSDPTFIFEILLHVVYYCRWPGIVTPDPWSANEYIEEGREGCIYHVEFLGKVRTHLWLPEGMVRK